LAPAAEPERRIGDVPPVNNRQKQASGGVQTREDSSIKRIRPRPDAFKVNDEKEQTWNDMGCADALGKADLAYMSFDSICLIMT
jgi:hypothetical protein